MNVTRTNEFVFKTIRSDEYDYWGQFVGDLVRGERYSMRPGPRLAYSMRLDSTGNYEVVPNSPKAPRLKIGEKKRLDQAAIGKLCQ